MMVSNSDISENSVIERSQSLIQTGDSLAAANMKFASHLCYLIAKIYPGKLEDKISLLGETTKNEILKSDRVEFLKFATFEAIMMTEVWEYAVALQNSNNNLDNLIAFQTFAPFKIMYATELYERQYIEKSLKYAECLTNNLEKLSGRLGTMEFKNEISGLAKLGYGLRRKVEEQISLGKTMLRAKENATNDKHSWLRKLDGMENVVLGFKNESREIKQEISQPDYMFDNSIPQNTGSYEESRDQPAKKRSHLMV